MKQKFQAFRYSFTPYSNHLKSQRLVILKPFILKEGKVDQCREKELEANIGPNAYLK